MIYDQTLSFTVKLPKVVNIKRLEVWQALLAEASICGKTNDCSDVPLTDDLNWVVSVLAIAQALVTILSLPAFEKFQILQFNYSEDEINKITINCRIPNESIVPKQVMDVVVKFSFKISYWLQHNDPATPNAKDTFFTEIQERLIKPLSKYTPTGRSTYEILKVAHQLHIPCRKLAGGAYQLGWGSSSRCIDRSTTDKDSAMGNNWTRSKTVTAALLRDAGLPTPTHYQVRDLKSALHYATKLGYPVVIKPADRERGEGVAVDVDANFLEAAFDYANSLSPSKTVLVERQVSGTCHRLFIFKGQLLYAVKRLPIGIYADGQNNITQLIDDEIRKQNELPPWKRSQLKPIEELANRTLVWQNLTPNSKPKKGTFVALRRIETTASGGVDEEVTSIVHPENIEIAVTAAKLLRLEVAGIDIISEDITRPWHENNAVINEVNYAPLLGGGDISKRYIPDYLDLLLRNEGRIPIHVYYGDTDAWAAAQDKWKDYKEAGIAVYLTCKNHTISPKGLRLQLAVDGIKSRLYALLARQDVEALVIVLQSPACLQEVQVLDKISSFTIVDSTNNYTDQSITNPSRERYIEMLNVYYGNLS